MECYKDLRKIAIELSKVMFGFLFEYVIKSLINALSYGINNNDAINDSVVSIKSLAVDDDFYEKSFMLLSFSYLSAVKVNEAESDIHDLYHLSEENFKTLNEWMQKYEELELVWTNF